MSMQQYNHISDTYKRQITCMTWTANLVVGFEDGCIKWFDHEAGLEKNSSKTHTGMITCFLFKKNYSKLFASSNDSSVTIWYKERLIERIFLNEPIFAIAFYQKDRFLLNQGSKIHMYKLQLDIKLENDSHKSKKPSIVRQSHVDTSKTLLKLCKNHSDCIMAIECLGSRFFAADMSGQICIYDYSVLSKQPSNLDVNDNESPQKQGKIKITCVKTVRAHTAGITTLLKIVDNDNNVFLMTGSYDNTVKVWSTDGKCRHAIDTGAVAPDFAAATTAIAWNSKTRTAWIACDSQNCLIWDPKQNENVTDFSAVNFNTNNDMPFATGKSQSTRFGFCAVKQTKKQRISSLAFNSHNGIMVAGTCDQKLIFWRFQPTGFIAAIKCQAAAESVAFCKTAPILIFVGGNDGDIIKWERQACQFLYEQESLPYFEAANVAIDIRKKLNSQGKNCHFQVSGDSGMKNTGRDDTNTNVGKGILSLIYNDSMEQIIAGCEDGNIYWIEICNKFIKYLRF